MKEGLAFEIINGDLVWIAESDDFSHLQLLETLVPAFDDDDCVFAQCEVMMVDKSGNALSKASSIPARWYDGREFLKLKMSLFDSIVNTGQALFRRSTLQQVSEQYLKYKLSGDYRLFCEIIIQGKVFASGLQHAFFRKHPDEMTSKYLGTIVYHREHLEMVDWLIDRKVTPKEVVQTITFNELVHLYCIGKGMPIKDYEEMIQLFKDACKKHQLNFPHVSATIKSLHLKGTHFYRKKIKNKFRFR